MVGTTVVLKTFRVDQENRQKEGHGFYKMDENNIQLLREDLTEEFSSLAQTHSKEVKKLFHDFEDE